MNELVVEQQEPVEGTGNDVWLMVIRDMEDRRQGGIVKYGQPVREDNGRDHLVDAYQEILDAAVYLRAEIERRRKHGG